MRSRGVPHLGEIDDTGGERFYVVSSNSAGTKVLLDRLPHLALLVFLVPSVDQVGKRFDSLIESGSEVAVGGIVGDGLLLDLARSLFLQQAVDGEAARVEADVLRLVLFTLR